MIAQMSILAAVDDLLFSSKIRATAKQVGADVQFARTPDEILAQARTTQPALVIFDLNSAKTDPVKTIAALKADPGHRVYPHDRVRVARARGSDRAARKAGADEVLPRSAFAGRLADILLSGATKP